MTAPCIKNKTPSVRSARRQGAFFVLPGKADGVRTRVAMLAPIALIAAIIALAPPAQAQNAAPAAPAASDAKPADAKPADSKPAEIKPDVAAKDAPKPDAAKDDAAKTNADKSDTAKEALKDAAKDAFGEAINMSARSVVLVKANAKWDTAFDTIIKTIKSAQAALDKAGGKAVGPYLIIYTSTDDKGFSFQVAIPVDDAPANLPKELTKGLSPAGKALKFVHRGSYDNMDNTYEAITNHLDEKKLEALDSFIEEYTTDPLNTAEDKLIINVLVPLKE